MIFHKIEQDNCFIIQQVVIFQLKYCGDAVLCSTLDESLQPTYIHTMIYRRISVMYR